MSPKFFSIRTDTEYMPHLVTNHFVEIHVFISSLFDSQAVHSNIYSLYMKIFCHKVP